MHRFLIGFLLLLLAYGGSVIVLPETTVSPGDLLGGHEEIASDCLACHKLFAGADSDRCQSCHVLEEIDLVTTRGEPLADLRQEPFHAALVDSACIACHTDHRGSDAVTTLAGISHELLSVSIRADCVRCHDAARPLDTLHRDAGSECGSCHQSDAWTPATIEHERYFRFDRRHPDECRSCHPQVLTSYTCYECHEHSQANVAHEHREEGIRNFEDCVECHRSGNEHEAKRRWRSLRGQRGRDGVRGSRSRYDGRREHHDDHDDDHDGDHDDDD